MIRNIQYSELFFDLQLSEESELIISKCLESKWRMLDLMTGILEHKSADVQDLHIYIYIHIFT
jgi:hypothetical protein